MKQKKHEVRCIHFKVGKVKVVKNLAKKLDCKLSIKRYASRVRKAENVLERKKAMLAISAKFANKIGADALLTGDTLDGVVASSIAVVRPLIGFNHNEIVSIAEKIGAVRSD
jgi:adenylyl- and sulfurtransferase ThiI